MAMARRVEMDAARRQTHCAAETGCALQRWQPLWDSVLTLGTFVIAVGLHFSLGSKMGGLVQQAMNLRGLRRYAGTAV